ncbi:unnamed protein product [Prorocentrum cordatum]|uniref:Uncharacterized protein n=1 Tax=Prorocentrum cordatum TaxID=2364126 RepID=A0ABN9TD88_9DINO|nr:unnamed protein product [Polarella glacialis]
MSGSMGIQVYYAADTKSLMPTVTAADVATATPMTPEQIADIFPHGLPDGFYPMICGTSYTAPAAAPLAEMKEAAQAVLPVEGKKEKKEKKKSSKKVKTSKKKSKGCC